MSAPSRSTFLSKVHRVLKKHYTPAGRDPEQPVLEALLYACCLENSSYTKAESAYGALKRTFFDWNEVRVATATELAEEISMAHNPAAAADRMRRILQHVFEAHYAFDLEFLKKENLGQAEKELRSIDGTNGFIASYAVQTALDGHSIPLDRGLLDAMYILDVISDAEREQGAVPGLERAISKSKGVEFASLAHEFGAELLASPYSAALHKIFVEINPEAKERLPKRPARSSAGGKRGAAKSKTASPAKTASKKKARAAASSKTSKKTKSSGKSVKRKPR